MARRRQQNRDDRPGLRTRVTGVLGSAGRHLGRMLPLLLLLASAAYGIVTLWQTAMADPRFRVGGETVSLSGAAEYCPAAREEIRRLGLQAAGRSVLDPWLLADLRRAYEASPWVKRVCRLARIFPDRVAVDFVLRMPVAQVASHGWYWLIDAEGVLLSVPGSEKPHAGLPEIVGNLPGMLSRQPAYGQMWSDVAVMDALGLLRVLRDSPLSEALHVRRLIVHRGSFLDTLECRRQHRPRLDIQTREGILVRWGTFNSADLPEELLNSEKLAMLRSLLSQDFVTTPGICLDVRTRVPGYAMPQD